MMTMVEKVACAGDHLKDEAIAENKLRDKQKMVEKVASAIKEAGIKRDGRILGALLKNTPKPGGKSVKEYYSDTGKQAIKNLINSKKRSKRMGNKTASAIKEASKPKINLVELYNKRLIRKPKIHGISSKQADKARDAMKKHMTPKFKDA
jgi:hypothetical protein